MHSLCRTAAKDVLTLFLGSKHNTSEAYGPGTGERLPRACKSLRSYFKASAGNMNNFSRAIP
eukprot:738247-Amphidinium_carterae.2